MKNFFKYIILALCVIILIPIVALLFKYSNNLSTLDICTFILDIIALIFGGIYLGKGATKDEQLFYKLFLGFYLLSLYTLIHDYILNDATSDFLNVYDYSISVFVLLFGGACVLICAKDLGKRKSYLITYIGTLIMLCLVVYAAINFPFNFENNINNMILLIQLFVPFILQLILSANVYLKYIDKKERHNLK